MARGAYGPKTITRPRTCTRSPCTRALRAAPLPRVRWSVYVVRGVSLLRFAEAADVARVCLGATRLVPDVRQGTRARYVVCAARRRVHPFRFRARDRARAAFSMVGGRRLFQRRHEPAVSVRVGGRVLAGISQARADGLGRARGLRQRVCVARCGASLVLGFAPPLDVPDPTRGAVCRRARLVVVQRDGGRAVPRPVGRRADRVGRSVDGSRVARAATR